MLELKNLSKRFSKSTLALSDVCLSSRDREFISIVGPSGCGKTTLLRIIAGLEIADTGSVIVGDRDVSGMAPRERDVAMVFQGESLYPHLSVRANLSFPLEMREQTNDAINSQVEAMAKQIGIDELLDLSLIHI